MWEDEVFEKRQIFRKIKKYKFKEIKRFGYLESVTEKKAKNSEKIKAKIESNAFLHYTLI